MRQELAMKDLPPLPPRNRIPVVSDRRARVGTRIASGFDDDV
jgi:hypothetical protein